MPSTRRWKTMARTRSISSFVKSIAARPAAVWRPLMRKLNKRKVQRAADRIKYPWYEDDGHARPNQRPPEGDWRIWLLLAGRGFGKTRAGAEFVRHQVKERLARRL